MSETIKNLRAELDESNAQNKKLNAQNEALEKQVRRKSALLAQLSKMAIGGV